MGTGTTLLAHCAGRIRAGTRRGVAQRRGRARRRGVVGEARKVRLALLGLCADAARLIRRARRRGAGAGGGAGNGASGSGVGGAGAGGSTQGGTSPGGAGNGGSAQAGAGGGGSGPPTAQQLLGKLGSCTKVKGPFNPDGPDTGSIDVCKTGNALWWKADLDVDCDGIQTPPCNTDNTGQPQTSIVDLATCTRAE